LAVPTLVVHDEGDRVSPLAVGRRLNDAIQGAQFLTTRGLGHRRVLADEAVAHSVAQHLRLDGRPNESEM
jgi:pimeloyl-ACP methyl ester carboxylesterase